MIHQPAPLSPDPYCYYIIRDISSSVLYIIYFLTLLYLTYRLIRKIPSSYSLTNRRTVNLNNKFNRQSQKYNKNTSNNTVHNDADVLRQRNIVMDLRALGQIMLGCLAIAALAIGVMEVIYYQSYGTDRINQDYQGESVVNFGFNFIVVFIFQAAVFIGIRIWLKQYIHIIQSQYNNMKLSIATTLSAQQLQAPSLKLIKSLLKIIKIYIFFRIIPFVVCVVLFTIAHIVDHGSQTGIQEKVLSLGNLSVVYLAFQFGQTTLCVLLLVICWCCLRTDNSYAIAGKAKNQVQKVSKKFMMILIPTCFRLFMIAVNLYQFYNIDKNDNKMCEISDGFIAYPYGLQALGGIGIYVFPFFVLLRTYQPVGVIAHYYQVPENTEVLIST